MTKTLRNKTPLKQDIYSSLADGFLQAADLIDTPNTRPIDPKPDLDFRDYLPYAWAVVEPNRTFQPNWSTDAVAEHLHAVAVGDIRKLIINIPPRQGKSLIASVLWFTWVWTWNPWSRWLCASYSYNFSKRDALKARTLIESAWYQSEFDVTLNPNQNEKMLYLNTATGYRLSTSVGGTAVGEGGDYRLIDDPIKPLDVWSDIKREEVIKWWADTWLTREVDPKRDKDVIIMQRLHERDLCGYIEDEVGGFEILKLPMRYDSRRHCATSIGWEDPRKKDGQLLHPERYGEPEVKSLETRMINPSAQLQQEAGGAEGDIFKRWWWGFWIPAGTDYKPVPFIKRDGEVVYSPIIELPEFFDEEIQSWDLAFKSTKASSFVCGQAWGRRDSNRFLLGQRREKLDFTDTLDAIRDFSELHPHARLKLIEDKANGPAVMSVLRREMTGLLPVEPYGSKEARARAVSPEVRAGRVFLPHPEYAPWVKILVRELTSFPNSAKSDQVDTLSQALARWIRGVFWSR